MPQKFSQNAPTQNDVSRYKMNMDISPKLKRTSGEKGLGKLATPI